MVVLDTSALIFWTLDRKRLSEAAATAIAEADRILVCSISIWEMGIKVNRGRLSIPLTVREYADKLVQVERVEILPVDTATWLKNVELEWAHRDPADRAIVAVALLHSCPLITSDRAIREFYPDVIW